MTSQKEFLKNIVEKLQQAGIDYVICGFTAASFGRNDPGTWHKYIE